MSKRHPSTGHPSGGGRYEIRLQGHLADRWSAWFDGLALTRNRDGTTVIAGAVVDQAALHGLLQRVRDTGLPLVSVDHIHPDHASCGPDPPRPDRAGPDPPRSGSADPDSSDPRASTTDQHDTRRPT